MAQGKDYYDILGVSRDADAKTIKRAFLKLARSYHPDVNKDEGAEAKFKEINEAYSVLSDDQKRANYDRYGTADGPGGFGSDFVDMSDIFSGSGFDVSDIFSSFFGGNRTSPQGASPRGRDMSISLTITLEEAAQGCTKKISYERLAPCDDCAGKGASIDAKLVDCTQCQGRGYIMSVQQTLFGRMQTQTTCPSCQGACQVFDKPCETCEGQGRCPSREKVEVKIPAGIQSSQRISLADKGEAGMHGSTSGSLIVRVMIAEHERFERDGDNLYTSMTIDSLEAITGTKRQLQGILDNEELEVHVPSFCEYGQRITLAHKGMPRMSSKSRGDLIVVISVKAPKGLSKEDKKTIQTIVDARGHATTSASSKTK